MYIVAIENFTIHIKNYLNVKEKWLECVYGSLWLQQIFNISAGFWAQIFCAVFTFLKYRCIYATTGSRRSPKAWQTLKVSARLHSEDAYSQSRQQGSADLCFKMYGFKINLFLGSRLLFVNCGRKYDKRRRQPEVVFESRVTSNGWHRSGSTSLTLKGWDNLVMTYRGRCPCLVMMKTTMILHKELATTPVQLRTRWFPTERTCAGG